MSSPDLLQCVLLFKKIIDSMRNHFRWLGMIVGLDFLHGLNYILGFCAGRVAESTVVVSCMSSLFDQIAVNVPWPPGKNIRRDVGPHPHKYLQLWYLSRWPFADEGQSKAVNKKQPDQKAKQEAQTSKERKQTRHTAARK